MREKSSYADRVWRRLDVGTAGVLSAAVMITGCDAGTPVRPDPSSPVATAVAGPARPRAAHTATLLSDGRVLLAGGCDSDGCTAAATAPSAEIYVPGRGFEPGPPMRQPRDGHTATVLRDGRVLFVGGFSREGAPPLASAELFNPATGTFEAAGELATARGGHVAALLPDGRVLIAGGWTGPRRYTASVEIFDPADLSFTAAAPMGRARHAAVASTLTTGEVLVSGGQDAPGHGLNTAELYDPARRRWQPTAPMASPRFKHAAVVRADGRVLILGGTTDDEQILAGVEVYDPPTRSFSVASPMTVGRYKFADAVAARADGSLVVAGGGTRVETLAAGGSRFAAVPGTDQSQRSFATATALADGNVLVVGGYDRTIRLHADAFLITTDGRRVPAA
jgi:hypothetical protein